MRLCLALLLCLSSAAVLAGVPLPEPGARYVERDPAAMAMHARQGDNARFRSRLNAQIRKNPKDGNALLHRAYLLHASGDIEAGNRDYERVLTLPGIDPVARRRALWSLGWSAYNRGLPEEAVAHWQQAAAAHGGGPSWYPYTIAIGLWSQGEKDAALAWYAAAAASQPEWAEGEGVAARTRQWRDPERRAIEALFKAWSEGVARPAG